MSVGRPEAAANLVSQSRNLLLKRIVSLSTDDLCPAVTSTVVSGSVNQKSPGQMARRNKVAFETAATIEIHSHQTT
jgi:hypothetical protein